MRKFDQTLEDYKKQIIQEEGEVTASGYFNSLIAPFNQGKPLLTPNYKPENVYYLVGGAKNLPQVRTKLGSILNKPDQAPKVDKTQPLKPNQIVTGQGQKVNGKKLLVVKDMGTNVEVRVLDNQGKPYPQPTTLVRLTDIVESTIHEAALPPTIKAKEQTSGPAFDYTGKINNSNEFSTRLYNALSEAGELNRNYISLNELIRGYLRGKSTTGNQSSKEEISEDTNIPKEVAHASVMAFIKQHGLQNLIIYAKPEQIPELDKGNLGKRIKTGLDIAGGKAIQGVGNAIKGAAKTMTTGQINWI